MRFARVILFAVAFAATLMARKDAARQPTLTPQDSGTKNSLIAVSAANARVVWASGRNGTFTVTTDGGETWKSGVVPGAEKLEFRDVEAVSDKAAYLLSVGTQPGDFRIYHTADGGATWTMQFQNQTAKAFYDCFAFWKSSGHGIAHSDSVDGVFPDLRTTDGKTWQDIGRKVPAALPDEGSFASSGTCVSTQGKQNAWIATGNATGHARVLVSNDGGESWKACDTPLKSAQGAGAFSIAFRDAQNGIIGGGALKPGSTDPALAAVSHDGGKTWSLTNPPPVKGTIFGLSYLGDAKQERDKRVVVVTGNDGGAAWSPDEGTTWYTLPDVSGYWGITFAGPQAGWLVGTQGKILKIAF